MVEPSSNEHTEDELSIKGNLICIEPIVKLKRLSKHIILVHHKLDSNPNSFDEAEVKKFF